MPLISTLTTGVSALRSFSKGIEVIGKPDGFGRQKRDEFNEKIYHKPADKPAGDK